MKKDQNENFDILFINLQKKNTRIQTYPRINIKHIKEVANGNRRRVGK